MIRFAKRLIGFAACIVVALVLVRFGPTLWVRIFWRRQHAMDQRTVFGNASGKK